MLAGYGYKESPFFALYQDNEYVLTFMVALAMAAAFIASQALFTGCFSLVAQAVRLGLAPRAKVTCTSDENASQVYVPTINTFLLIGAISFVLIFPDPDAMTFAYGMAVGTGMSITYTLVRRYYREHGCRYVWLIDVCGVFIIILTLGAYSKLLDSPLGLIPLGSMVLFTSAMAVWGMGRKIVDDAEAKEKVDTFAHIINHDEKTPFVHTPVMRVFLCAGAASMDGNVPLAFYHYLDDWRGMPQTAVFVHIDRIRRAHVPIDKPVAQVQIFENHELVSSFEIPLRDLPPEMAPLSQLRRWAKKALEIAPKRVKDGLSVE